MAEKETEFKFQLSPEQYDRLCSLLDPPKSERRFANRYYTVIGNTRADWVLRLRVEGEQSELTLKIGRIIANGVYDSTEYTEYVSTANPEEWTETEPIRLLRREVSAEPIVFQGEAKNHRRVHDAPLPVGRIWELDCCELPNGLRFYELEIEVQANSLSEVEQMRASLDRWLETHELALKPSTTTKYKRFLASIGL